MKKEETKSKKLGWKFDFFKTLISILKRRERKYIAVSKNYRAYHDNLYIFHKRRRTKKFLINSIEAKLLVYEDRVKSWFFDIGNNLKGNNEAGFIILSIALQYIESNQQFREGKASEGDSRECFNRGFKRIFNNLYLSEANLEELGHIIYGSVRCGLFHDQITGRDIYIHAGENTPVFVWQQQNIGNTIRNIILINPHKFLDMVNQDFHDYISKLKDEGQIELRENFDKMFNLC